MAPVRENRPSPVWLGTIYPFRVGFPTHSVVPPLPSRGMVCAPHRLLTFAESNIPNTRRHNMAKPMHPTPNLDQLESGPWPSFVTGLKRLAKDKDYVVDLLGHLEHSYQTRKGYWKGGTVGVRGYG